MLHHAALHHFPLITSLPGCLPLPAVFDTAILTEGHLYQLDQHLQRFLTNAARANIPLPPGISAEQMRRTILETAAASCKLNGAGRCVAVLAVCGLQCLGVGGMVVPCCCI